MSKIGKYLVYWNNGNVHHFFDTFEAAEKYCAGSSTGPSIAYVLYETKVMGIKAGDKIIDFLKEVTS